MNHLTDQEYLQAYIALSVNVDAGESFLDRVDPEWYKKIPLPQLQIDDGENCICGWVFKDLTENKYGFGYFIDHFDSKNGFMDAVAYGFMPDHEHVHLVSEPQWSILGEIWSTRVEKRLADDGLLD